jgi:hypothetical protein
VKTRPYSGDPVFNMTSVLVRKRDTDKHERLQGTTETVHPQKLEEARKDPPQSPQSATQLTSDF